MKLFDRIRAWFRCKHVLYPGDAKCMRCGVRLS